MNKTVAVLKRLNPILKTFLNLRTLFCCYFKLEAKVEKLYELNKVFVVNLLLEAPFEKHGP